MSETFAVTQHLSRAHRYAMLHREMGSRAAERIASGMRVRTGADDPGAVALSQHLEARVRGAARVDRNVQDAISMLQAAEVSFDQVQDILHRIRELALQAANDTLSDSDRLIVDREVSELKTAAVGILSGTRWNRQRLFLLGTLRDPAAPTSESFTQPAPLSTTVSAGGATPQATLTLVRPLEEYSMQVSNSAVGTVPTADWAYNAATQVVTFSAPSATPATGTVAAAPFTTLVGSTQVTKPGDVAVAASGDVYVADTANDRVLKVAADGTVTTLLGSTQVNNPGGVDVAASGEVYVADTANDRVLKVATDGTITTVVGSTQVKRPGGVAVASSGEVYVADTANDRVLKVATDGTVTTVIATGQAIDGVAVTSTGDLYVTDTNGERVLKVASGGGITTVAGSPGFELQEPRKLAVAATGEVYVADAGDNRILRIATDGTITTEVSSAEVLDGATLQNPSGIAVAANGDVYIADTNNNRVLKRDSTFTATLSRSYASDDLEVTHATLGTIPTSQWSYTPGTTTLTITAPGISDGDTIQVNPLFVGATITVDAWTDSTTGASNGDGIVDLQLAQTAEDYNVSTGTIPSSVRVSASGTEVTPSYTVATRTASLSGANRPQLGDTVQATYHTDYGASSSQAADGDGEVQIQLNTTDSITSPATELVVVISGGSRGTVELSLDAANGYTYDDSTKIVTLHGTGRLDATETVTIDLGPTTVYFMVNEAGDAAATKEVQLPSMAQFAAAVSAVSVGTRADALATIDAIDSANASLHTARGDLAAHISSLHQMANAAQSQNIVKARSLKRVERADLAKETTILVSKNLAARAAMAVAAQGNSTASDVAYLLGTRVGG